MRLFHSKAGPCCIKSLFLGILLVGENFECTAAAANTKQVNLEGHTQLQNGLKLTYDDRLLKRDGEGEAPNYHGEVGFEMPEMPPPPIPAKYPSSKKKGGSHAVERGQNVGPSSFWGKNKKTRNFVASVGLAGAIAMSTAAIRSASHLPIVPQCFRDWFGYRDYPSDRRTPPAVDRATKKEVARALEVVAKASEDNEARKRAEEDGKTFHLVKRSTYIEEVDPTYLQYGHSPVSDTTSSAFATTSPAALQYFNVSDEKLLPELTVALFPKVSQSLVYPQQVKVIPDTPHSSQRTSNRFMKRSLIAQDDSTVDNANFFRRDQPSAPPIPDQYDVQSDGEWLSRISPPSMSGPSPHLKDTHLLSPVYVSNVEFSVPKTKPKKAVSKKTLSLIIGAPLAITALAAGVEATERKRKRFVPSQQEEKGAETHCDGFCDAVIHSLECSTGSETLIPDFILPQGEQVTYEDFNCGDEVPIVAEESFDDSIDSNHSFSLSKRAKLPQFKNSAVAKWSFGAAATTYLISSFANRAPVEGAVAKRQYVDVEPSFVKRQEVIPLLNLQRQSPISIDLPNKTSRESISTSQPSLERQCDTLAYQQEDDNSIGSGIFKRAGGSMSAIKAGLSITGASALAYLVQASMHPHADVPEPKQFRRSLPQESLNREDLHRRSSMASSSPEYESSFKRRSHDDENHRSRAYISKSPDGEHLKLYLKSGKLVIYDRHHDIEEVRETQWKENNGDDIFRHEMQRGNDVTYRIGSQLQRAKDELLSPNKAADVLTIRKIDGERAGNANSARSTTQVSKLMIWETLLAVCLTFFLLVNSADAPSTEKEERPLVKRFPVAGGLTELLATPARAAIGSSSLSAASAIHGSRDQVEGFYKHQVLSPSEFSQRHLAFEKVTDQDRTKYQRRRPFRSRQGQYRRLQVKGEDDVGQSAASPSLGPALVEKRRKIKHTILYRPARKALLKHWGDQFRRHERLREMTTLPRNYIPVNRNVPGAAFQADEIIRKPKRGDNPVELKPLSPGLQDKVKDQGRFIADHFKAYSSDPLKRVGQAIGGSIVAGISAYGAVCLWNGCKRRVVTALRPGHLSRGGIEMQTRPLLEGTDSQAVQTGADIPSTPIPEAQAEAILAESEVKEPLLSKSRSPEQNGVRLVKRTPVLGGGLMEAVAPPPSTFSSNGLNTAGYNTLGQVEWSHELPQPFHLSDTDRELIRAENEMRKGRNDARKGKKIKKSRKLLVSKQFGNSDFNLGPKSTFENGVGPEVTTTWGESPNAQPPAKKFPPIVTEWHHPPPPPSAQPPQQRSRIHQVSHWPSEAPAPPPLLRGTKDLAWKVGASVAGSVTTLAGVGYALRKGLQRLQGKKKANTSVYDSSSEHSGPSLDGSSSVKSNLLSPGGKRRQSDNFVDDGEVSQKKIELQPKRLVKRAASTAKTLGKRSTDETSPRLVKRSPVPLGDLAVLSQNAPIGNALRVGSGVVKSSIGQVEGQYKAPEPFHFPEAERKEMAEYWNDKTGKQAETRVSVQSNRGAKKTRKLLTKAKYETMSSTPAAAQERKLITDVRRYWHPRSGGSSSSSKPPRYHHVIYYPYWVPVSEDTTPGEKGAWHGVGRSLDPTKGNGGQKALKAMMYVTGVCGAVAACIFGPDIARSVKRGVRNVRDAGQDLVTSTTGAIGRFCKHCKLGPGRKIVPEGLSLRLNPLEREAARREYREQMDGYARRYHNHGRNHQPYRNRYGEEDLEWGRRSLQKRGVPMDEFADYKADCTANGRCQLFDANEERNGLLESPECALEKDATIPTVESNGNESGLSLASNDSANLEDIGEVFQKRQPVEELVMATGTAPYSNVALLHNPLQRVNMHGLPQTIRDHPEYRHLVPPPAAQVDSQRQTKASSRDNVNKKGRSKGQSKASYLSSDRSRKLKAKEIVKQEVPSAPLPLLSPQNPTMNTPPQTPTTTTPVQPGLQPPLMDPGQEGRPPYVEKKQRGYHPSLRTKLKWVGIAGVGVISCVGAVAWTCYKVGPRRQTNQRRDLLGDDFNSDDDSSLVDGEGPRGGSRLIPSIIGDGNHLRVGESQTSRSSLAVNDEDDDDDKDKVQPSMGGEVVPLIDGVLVESQHHLPSSKTGLLEGPESVSKKMDPTVQYFDPESKSSQPGKNFTLDGPEDVGEVFQKRQPVGELAMATGTAPYSNVALLHNPMQRVNMHGLHPAIHDHPEYRHLVPPPAAQVESQRQTKASSRDKVNKKGRSKGQSKASYLSSDRSRKLKAKEIVKQEVPSAPLPLLSPQNPATEVQPVLPPPIGQGQEIPTPPFPDTVGDEGKKSSHGLSKMARNVIFAVAGVTLVCGVGLTYICRNNLKALTLPTTSTLPSKRRDLLADSIDPDDDSSLVDGKGFGGKSRLIPSIIGDGYHMRNGEHQAIRSSLAMNDDDDDDDDDEDSRASPQYSTMGEAVPIIEGNLLKSQLLSSGDKSVGGRESQTIQTAIRPSVTMKPFYSLLNAINVIKWRFMSRKDNESESTSIITLNNHPDPTITLLSFLFFGVSATQGSLSLTLSLSKRVQSQHSRHSVLHSRMVHHQAEVISPHRRRGLALVPLATTLACITLISFYAAHQSLADVKMQEDKSGLIKRINPPKPGGKMETAIVQGASALTATVGFVGLKALLGGSNEEVMSRRRTFEGGAVEGTVGAKHGN